MARFVSPPLARAVVGLPDRIPDEGDGVTLHDALKAGAYEAIAEAVYERLAETKIIYKSEPYALGRNHIQRLRSPGEIASSGEATCVDLALLYAGLLLDAGLHPVLLVQHGHTLVAFLKPSPGIHGIEPDMSLAGLHSLLEDGLLVPIECTGVAVGKGLSMSFNDALAAGAAAVVANEHRTVVDPRLLHSREYVPIESEPDPPRSLLPVLLAVALAVLAASGLGYRLYQGQKLTVFDAGETGLVLTPAAHEQAGQPRGSSELSERFDRLFGEGLRANGSVLAAYPQAKNTDGHALLSPDPVERDAQALRLLRRSGASVLLAPVLRTGSGNRAEFNLEGWLGQVAGAEELAGQRLSFLFCGQRSVVFGDFRRVNADTDANLRALIAGPDDAASAGIANVDTFLSALGAYRRYDHVEAIEKLDRLIVTATAPGGDCARADAAPLYHLRANMDSDLGRWIRAIEGYESALAADPNFHRSTVGLAEAILLSVTGDGCQQAELGDVGRSLELTEAVLDADGAAADSQVFIGANVIRAQAWICYAAIVTTQGVAPGSYLVAAVEALDEALARFEDLEAAEDPERELVRESAAVGYWQRAEVRRRQSALADVTADLRSAIGLSARPLLHARINADLMTACADGGDSDCAKRAADDGCIALDSVRRRPEEATSGAAADIGRLNIKLGCA